jgi:purine-binding chemotaxis protein CheW
MIIESGRRNKRFDMKPGEIYAHSGSRTMYKEENQEKQLVVFKLEGQSYAVDITKVSEMINLQTLVPVFETPVYIEGMIEVRGNSVPVIDLRKRFHLAKKPRNQDNRILVVNCKGYEVGIIVDSVSELLKVSPKAVKSLECLFIGEHLEHLLGVVRLTEKNVILMDMDTILSSHDLDAIRDWNNSYSEAVC